MIKVKSCLSSLPPQYWNPATKLDETGQRILFIAPEGRLKAVITTCDIRKFFLRGVPDRWWI